VSGTENKTTVTLLERGRESIAIAERALIREREEQMHLWQRYRDIVAVYIGQLALLGAAVQNFAAAEAVWFETRGACWVTPFLGVAVLVDLVCLYQLYSIFDGDKYRRPDPKVIRHSLLHLDHFYHRDMHPDKGHVYKDFYELTDEQMFAGGLVPSASIGEPLHNITIGLLEAAISNEKKNEKRSTRLMYTRWTLIFGVFSAIVTWIITTAAFA
jgi:hypothetical protein